MPVVPRYLPNLFLFDQWESQSLHLCACLPFQHSLMAYGGDAVVRFLKLGRGSHWPCFLTTSFLATISTQTFFCLSMMVLNWSTADAITHDWGMRVQALSSRALPLAALKLISLGSIEWLHSRKNLFQNKLFSRWFCYCLY